MNLTLGPYGEGAETLLHGEFGAYPSKGSRYALSLTQMALHIQRLVPKPETDQRTVVPLAEKRKVAVGLGRGRQRAARTFQVDGADDYEKNQAVAEKWAAAIKCLVLGIPVSSETAVHLCAGQVLNGLMERHDWEEAIKMPVGILPSGSGNALAGAINCNAGRLEQVLGLELLLNCTLLLCHAAVAPLDLVAITMASGARCFSCLSVAWGFVSDVDIESEKYRHMGAARFTLGTLPVPGSWMTVEDNFVLVLAIYQSHLGADLFTAPFARFDDGLIHLCFIKAGISRAALIRLFLAMEKGSHFEQECPHLVHVPVRAFRLEPLTHKGILTVDGERVEYGPIQGQVHQGLARLITGVNRLKIASG
ncbi:Sphingosine kinase 1 [Chelonia mydas]|uniref:Sphingosine kinase 1 n=1 Tax=Chelonia mydas TaxID=8469 RepID=M7BKS3_CHEMY|nr:Sphingosine kinase 1 [Chelonia mydas]